MYRYFWKPGKDDHWNDPAKSAEIFDQIFRDIGWVPVDEAKQKQYKQSVQPDVKRAWYCPKWKTDKFIKDWDEYGEKLLEERRAQRLAIQQERDTHAS